MHRGLPGVRGGLLIEPAQPVGEAHRKRAAGEGAHAIGGEQLDHEAEAVLQPREIALVVDEIEFDQRMWSRSTTA